MYCKDPPASLVWRVLCPKDCLKLAPVFVSWVQTDKYLLYPEINDQVYFLKFCGQSSSTSYFGFHVHFFSKIVCFSVTLKNNPSFELRWLKDIKHQ